MKIKIISVSMNKRLKRHPARSKVRILVGFAIWIFFSTLTAAGVYLAGRSGIFSIKAISCKVDGVNECSAEITAELNRYIGKNLLRVGEAEIEKRIVSANRLAKTVRVNLRLPDSLGVEIVSRKPAAEISSAQSAVEAVEVDSAGVILGTTKVGGEAPRLIWPGISHWPIENPVPENIVKASAIASLAGEKFQLGDIASIDSGSSAGMTMVIRLKSGEKIRLSLNKDPVEQLATLQVVLNQVKIEGKPIQEIDLRFDRPVIR